MIYQKIALVVPVLNNFYGLAELMHSISGDAVMPIVVDNWRYNRGVAAGWNHGINIAIESGATHILICNDDVILFPYAPIIMANRLSSLSNDYAMVTGRNVRSQIDPDSEDIPGQLEALSVSQGFDPPLGADSPDFSCFMITPSVYQEIGSFDENIYPAYFEDNDYHHRIHLAGMKTANLAEVPIFHRGSKTQNHDLNAPVVSSKQFESNRNYYKYKWGGVPGEEKYPTPYNNGRLSYRNWLQI